MADFSKIGRNNKNRGRAFERKVASILEWTRVPYSGAIKDWGGGDVVDGFYKKKGFWSAECKTQQPSPVGSLSVQQKWLQQVAKATSGGRRGILVLRTVATRQIYVLMRMKPFEIILDNMMPSELDNILTAEDIKASGNGMGFTIPRQYLRTVDGITTFLSFHVVSKKLDEDWWWVLCSIDTFKRYIDKYDLMEHDEDAEHGNGSTDEHD